MMGAVASFPLSIPRVAQGGISNRLSLHFRTSMSNKSTPHGELPDESS